MTCSTCRFASVEVGDDDEPRLDCRRYPPLVVVDDRGLVNVWPQVEGHDWCGEWSEVAA